MTELAIDRRRLLVTGRFAVATSFITAASTAAPLPVTPPRILFICQYGTAKSAIAREVFRRRASERGIPAVAFSRGITPGEHVSPALRARLLADGIDSTRDGVRTLTPNDLEAADIVVAFDPLPKAMSEVRVLDWSGLPSMNDAYPRARADLIRRVDALLDRIATDQLANPASPIRRRP